MGNSPQELFYSLTNDNSLANGIELYYTISPDEPIYKIDLNTRDVETPEFLSVLEDHNAEVVWFKVDRFHDDVDLYGTTCWIQYKNAEKEEYITASIPRAIDDNNHNMLYIPWPITGPATRAAGPIEFSFQFFKLDETKKKVLFSLHTKTVKSKILYGLHINPLDSINYDEVKYERLAKMLETISSQYDEIKKEYNLYWYEP